MGWKSRSGRRLKVGVIGCGWVATERHIPAFRKDSRVLITAVADRSPARARAVARRFGILHHSTHPDEVIQLADAVSICTPPWTHAELSINALSKGCHVLVEKPMATNLGDATQMRLAAEGSNRVLCVSHNFLFSSSVQSALRLTAEGKIGKVHTVLASQLSSWSRRLPKWHMQLPGGLFYDEAPHMVYLIREFVGELNVAASAVRFTKDGALSRVSARLDGARGDASFEMVLGAPVSEWLLAVIGSQGVLLIDIFRDILLLVRSDGSHRPIDVLQTSVTSISQHLLGAFRSGLSLLAHQLTFGHDELVRRFVDSILCKAPVPAGASDGLEVIRVLDEILSGAPGWDSGLRHRNTKSDSIG